MFFLLFVAIFKIIQFYKLKTMTHDNFRIIQKELVERFSVIFDSKTPHRKKNIIKIVQNNLHK